MHRIALVVHNVRSAYNVGSLLRTADGLGIDEVFLSGYTPYPAMKNDPRLPHIQERVSQSIHKTALGAEESAKWRHFDSLGDCVHQLKAGGYEIAALEQTDDAQELAGYSAAADVALVVGNEITGLEEDELKQIAVRLKIPMLGRKESFNVAAAAAMALYHLRYIDKNTS